MGRDIDFLQDVEPLTKYLGDQFPLRGNAFLLPKDVVLDAEKVNQMSLPHNPTRENSLALRGQSEFGVPESFVETTTNGEFEWSESVIMPHADVDMDEHGIEYVGPTMCY